MTKYIVLASLIFILSGCGQVVSQDVSVRENIEQEVVPPSSIEPSKSPLSALLEEVQIGKSGHEYARITNIRIVSDAKGGFNPDSFTVTYTEEGLADDEINKSEEELKLQKQNDGTWKVIDKKITKQECHPGRCYDADKLTKSYKNEAYGFQFRYPESVIVENGGKGIYFRLKEPLITVKTKEGDLLFTIGTTDYFVRDDASQKYILQSPTEVIKLQKNCTKLFFGIPSIQTAQMSFGDGMDWSVFYNILNRKNVGFGIETHRRELLQSDLTEADFKKEYQRIDLEKQILSTLSFSSDSQSVSFTCK